MSFSWQRCAVHAMRAVRYCAVVAVSVAALAGFGALFEYLLSFANATNFESGEKPRAFFQVAVVRDAPGTPFEVMPLNSVNADSGTFLLPKEQDELAGPDTQRNRYTVLSRTDREQLIEVWHHNGDYDTWSRYRASAYTVTPVYERVMGPGEAVMGGILSLLATPLLGYGMLQLRRRAQ